MSLPLILYIIHGTNYTNYRYKDNQVDLNKISYLDCPASSLIITLFEALETNYHLT